MRENLLSFLDCTDRGNETAFAYRRGLRLSKWSYSRLRNAAFQFARELERRQIAKGDRVLFWAESSPEWVAAFFGCLLRGAIAVPLDIESSADFVIRVQDQVAAKLLLYGGGIKCDRLETPKLSLDRLSDEISDHSTEPVSPSDIRSTDVAEIIFTSGTTADPKGVCLTHKNILANINPLEPQIQPYLKYERIFHPVRFLNLLPLSHVFGQFMGILVPSLLGGEVYFQDSLNPSEIISTVRKNRISVIVSVPRVLDSLRYKIERDYEARGKAELLQRKLQVAENVHFLKRWWMFRRVHSQFGWKFWSLLSGGAALSAETEAFWRRMGFAVVQGYGMTEAAALVTVNHPFNLSRRSIGKTLPGHEVRLDEHGEILIRGDNISPGYWGDRRTLTSDDGWLRTGDVGELDDQGNLYFKSRQKDVIVTGAGTNIYPDDLEAALNSQPDVRDSVVLGIDGPRGTEPMAVLLLRDEKADAATIVKKANDALNPYQQIRRWSIWPEEDFPRTTTQKIRKAVVLEKLSELAVADNGSTRSSGTAAARASFILNAVARVSGEVADTVDSAAHLETDLNLDSLDRVELLGALEDHYQVDIDEAAFTAATTIDDIEKMIRQGATEKATRYEYPRWARRFPITWIRSVVFYLVILPLTRLMSRASVTGSDRLRGVEGPVLFVSNHIAMVDAALILRALPARFQTRFAIAMEGEVLRDYRHPSRSISWYRRWISVAKYFLLVSVFNVFPLPQKSGFRKSFEFAGETMDRGYSVLVFPEGRRTPDGEMKPFKDGIGLLTKSLGVPVVPARIEGLYELKVSRRFFARPGEIVVSIGEPAQFRDDDDPSEIARDLQNRVASLA